MIYVVAFRLTSSNHQRKLFFMSVKEVTQVRMDAKLKKRVRDYIKQVEEKAHVKIGFGEAVRSLVEQSLDREGVK